MIYFVLLSEKHKSLFVLFLLHIGRIIIIILFYKIEKEYKLVCMRI